MAAKWIETLTGSLEQKKQYRQHKARIEALPRAVPRCREGIRAVLHVLRGHHRRRHAHHDVRRLRRPVGTGRRRRDPVGDIVGDDPVGFGETFIHSYCGQQWIDKERDRLVQAIDDVRQGDQA